MIIGREGRDIAEAARARLRLRLHGRERRHGARPAAAARSSGTRAKASTASVRSARSVVTADEIRDPQRLDISLRVNGVEKQRSNTRLHIFPVARLIAEWSAGMTLLPGDILLTGTPSGVGIGRKPPEFLRPGDVVEAEVAASACCGIVVGGVGA